MSFFSVLMPVYNTSRFLEAAVRSVLSQSFTDFEFLILDDGSTDQSLSMLREFEASDARIHVYTQENQNLLRTRKRLIESASGEYLVFLDSDDTLADGALAAMHQQLQQDQLDILIFYYDYIDEHGQFLRNTAPDSLPKDTLLTRAQLMFCLCQDAEMNSLCRKVIRRTCLLKAPSWETLPRLMMGEDKFMSSQAFRLAANGKIIDQIFYHYRMLDGSATHSVNMNYIRDFQFVRSSMFTILKEDTELSSVCMKSFLGLYVDDLVWFFKYYMKARVSFSQLDSFLQEAKKTEVYQYAMAHQDQLTASSARHLRELNGGHFLVLFLDSRLLRRL